MATKKTKTETKKSKRLLRVVLTREELLVAGKEQADKAIELGALESDLKRVTADFKAKIAAVDARLQSLAGVISSGYEYRNVTCTEYLGDPEPDKKRIVRDDTGEQVGLEEMSQAEMQRELLNGESQA
jgi:elongation factor P hydroxylase